MLAHKEVDAYIRAAPLWAKGILKDIRSAVQSGAPKAKESIGYGVPYYHYEGRLAYFAVHKNHCGFYWISMSDRKSFAKELATQEVRGSTLRIPKGGKVPRALIRNIVKMRTKTNASKEKPKTRK